MGHPIRLYCAGPRLPTVAELLSFAAGRGQTLTPYEEYAEDDPQAEDWDSAGFLWRPGRPPLFVEVERPDGPDARLVLAEVGATRRAIEALPPSPDREEARRRLRAVRFVVGVYAAAEALEGPGWPAADALAACFEREARAVAWVAGRGYFVDERPIPG